LSDGAGGIQSCNTFTYECGDTNLLTIDSTLISINSSNVVFDSSFIKTHTWDAYGLTSTTVINSFEITFGCSAIYEYCITESGGAKRMGQIMATWDTGGIAFTDNSTPDLNSSTAAFVWKIQLNGASVELVADISSGTWDTLVSIRIIF
jgi:hypothetical protein